MGVICSIDESKKNRPEKIDSIIDEESEFDKNREIKNTRKIKNKKPKDKNSDSYSVNHDNAKNINNDNKKVNPSVIINKVVYNLNPIQEPEYPVNPNGNDSIKNKNTNGFNPKNNDNNNKNNNHLNNTEKPKNFPSNNNYINNIKPRDNPNNFPSNNNYINNIKPRDNPKPKPRPRPRPKPIDKDYIMYDAIFSCESINELYDDKLGWKFTKYDKYIQRLIKGEKNDKKFCPLCVIGETNKGKTFILNLLTGNALPSGIEYKTVGISCKFTNFKNDEDDSILEKYLMFDSAGKSEPLLIEPEKKKNLRDEELKRKVESNYKDLKLSEEFMKNFLIKNSKIIIVVVNQLSLAEQLFLFELKNDSNYEELFIIHNLYHFKTRKELEEYINNTVINSIYFDLIKDYFYDIEDDDDNIENLCDKPYYFTEEIERKAIITHLIIGNYETKDPYIQKFNKETLEFLKNKMQVSNAKDDFDIKEMLEKELIEENLIEENSKLIEEEKEDLIDSDFPSKVKCKQGVIKLQSQKNNQRTEDDFTENREFNIMGYSPEYIYYLDERNQEFVVEIEVGGIKDDNIKITSKQKKAKVYFHIEGRKIYPEELRKSNPKKYSDKPFSIYFSINTQSKRIKIDQTKEANEKKPTYEKGIYRKAFGMKKDEKNVEKIK